MGFRYDEIGNRIKAFRLGSNLSADEIADQLGISRTALYRFERGEVGKLETIERLAELLGISIPSLLGVGIEYIPSAATYFERLRQIEATTEHIMALTGPIPFLLASDQFVDTIEEVLNGAAQGDRLIDDIPKIMKTLRERKDVFRRRKPALTNIVSAVEIEKFLQHGLEGGSGLSASVKQRRQAIAHQEVENLVGIMENPRIGLQIGVVRDNLPHMGFQIYREVDRKLLVLSPFRLGGWPNVRIGVAMISSATDAVASHERMMESIWERAAKGREAADLVKQYLASSSRATTGAISSKVSTTKPKKKQKNRV